MNHRPKVFYGWWVVATAAFGLFLGAGPIVVFSFGVFFKSLGQDFVAGRAAVSFAFTLFNMCGAISVALIGRLSDRFGARKVILAGTVIFALILLSGRVLGARIAYLYLFYASLGVISPTTTPVPYGTVVSRWFNRRRGLALGLMMLGMGLGAVIAPVAFQRLIATFGWRNAFAVLGCAVLLLALPVLANFLKNDPKDKGLLPDGSLPAQERIYEAARAQTHDQGLSWCEIWHSSTFWLLVGAFFLASAGVHACVLHMPALLTDRGVTAQAAAAASSLIGVALLVGRVGTGYLLDRFYAPRLATLFFGGAALGMALLMAGAAGKLALAAAFLIGLGMGAEGDIIVYTLSRYFGLRSLGTAYGYTFSAFVLAGALGTLLMGVGFDATHSYTLPLAGFFVAMLLAAALMTRLGPYRYGVHQVHHAPADASIAAESLG